MWGVIQDRLRSDWGKFGEENWEQEIWVEFVVGVRAKNKRDSCKLFFFLLTACWSKSISELTPENHGFLLPSFSLRSFFPIWESILSEILTSSQTIHSFSKFIHANQEFILRSSSFGPFLGRSWSQFINILPSLLKIFLDQLQSYLPTAGYRPFPLPNWLLIQTSFFLCCITDNVWFRCLSRLSCIRSVLKGSLHKSSCNVIYFPMFFVIMRQLFRSSFFSVTEGEKITQ